MTRHRASRLTPPGIAAEIALLVAVAVVLTVGVALAAWLLARGP